MLINLHNMFNNIMHAEWDIRLWSVCNCIRHSSCCLEAGKLEPFPHKSRLGGGVKNEDNFDVYCICRMPEMREVPMIECTRCTKWFHACCVEVSDTVLNTSESEWLCYSCI